MKHFKEENCSSKVRRQFVTITGEKISLIGKHAHKWGVVRETTSITMTIFNSRIAAVKQYHQLEKDLKVKR